MMPCWIGNSQEYIAVEYAKSNRSKCRQCKQKIEKDQIRIGLMTDNDQMPMSYWHHMNCFHFKPRHKALENKKLIQMLCGIGELDSQDCDKVLEHLEKQFKNFMENKYVKKSKPKKGEKSDKEESDNEKKEVKPQKGTKKTETEDKQKQQKGKKLKKTNTKKQEEKKFMSPEQQKIYQEYYDKYFSLTANELKEILQKNHQPKTGAKDVLATICADGKFFGRIPNCPSCAGGKLRFDCEKGTYKCPGYMEDTEFRHCRAVFAFDQIKRLQWVE